VGLVVDACQRYVRYQEARSRRQAWTRWEGVLADREGGHRAMAPPVHRRPVRLPPGPVEKVADPAAGVTLGAAAALLAAFGPTPLMGAAVAVGVPKAGQSGREEFAARLGRDAADRGTLVLDEGALRRLDRVDTIVLDGDVLRVGRYAVDDVQPLLELGGAEAAELVERAHDLVDLRRPQRRRARADWSIEPFTDPPAAALPLPVRDAAAALARRTSVVLVLRHGDQTVAVVGVSEALDPFAEVIAAAAGRAGLVLVAGPRELARRLEAGGTVPGGPGLADAIDALQADGHVVALVGNRADALAAADVGIGLVGGGDTPPWTADLLTRTAGEVSLLLNAIGPARQTSRRGAQLAIAGSALGALLAVLGPPTGAGARAAVAVHSAALLALGLGTWAGTGPGRQPEPVPADRTPWHAMSTRAVLESVDSSRTGLTRPRPTAAAGISPRPRTVSRSGSSGRRWRSWRTRSPPHSAPARGSRRPRARSWIRC
jgi:cation-transporting ATPase I